MKTRTGNYPIGFRRGGGDWQKDLPSLLEWASSNGLEVIDLSSESADTTAKAAKDAGLRVGSIDLADTKGMIAADKGKRKAAIERNSEQIRNLAKLGPINYFLVMLPDDPALPRSENFGYMVESFGELAPVFEQNKAKLVIEGWPGPGALCCTPEGYRAFFKQVSSPAMGINYDPSHLIRMRVDHIRFLHEFGDRVFHMHGKDTEILDEQIYEYGIEQPATFGKPRPFAGMSWRYTVPGFGVAHWIDIFNILKEKRYQGAVSIELEDASFYKEPDAEKLGILQGGVFPDWLLMKVIYHITTELAWAKAQAVGEVLADSLATEGFIHCSRQTQLLAVANRFIPGASGLLVLGIDEESVQEWLVNEGPVGVGVAFAQDVFPHIYAPIPVAAVVAVSPLTAGADGRFTWPQTLSRG